MQELIIAIVCTFGGILAIKAFDNYNITKNQKKLEDKVKESDKAQARLEGQQEQEDKETQRRVDEITEEQNNKPNSSSLTDWFTRRKS